MEILLPLGKLYPLPRDALDCCEPEAQLIKSFFALSSLFPSRLAMQSCWSGHGAPPRWLPQAALDPGIPGQPRKKQSSRERHSLQCPAAVTAAECPWTQSLSGYRSNPLKMTVLVRSVIPKAVRLCPRKAVGSRLQVCSSFPPPPAAL